MRYIISDDACCFIISTKFPEQEEENPTYLSSNSGAKQSNNMYTQYIYLKHIVQSPCPRYSILPFRLDLIPRQTRI